MKTLIKYTLLICITLIVSCSSDDSNTTIEQFWINSAKVDCTGAFEQQCYMVQNNETIIETDWEFFYDAIAGFDVQYEEGFIYRVKVRREEVFNPPADAGSYNYFLIEILSKDEASD